MDLNLYVGRKYDAYVFFPFKRKMHIFIIAGRGEDRKSADKSEGRLRQRILFYLHPDKNEKKEKEYENS